MAVTLSVSKSQTEPSPLTPLPPLLPLPTLKASQESQSEDERSHGGHVVGIGAAAAAEGDGGAVHAVRVARGGRAPQLPRLPPLDVRRPLRRGALGGVVGCLPPPRRRGALGGPPRDPGLRAAALRRAGPGLPHPGRLPSLPLPLRAPPRRAPPTPLPRPPPPRLRGRARGVRRAARPLLPPPRLLRRALLPRRRRLQGLLVLRRCALPLALVVRRRVRPRGRLLGVPHRRLLHGLRAVPDHLLPADSADGGIRARVRQVRRRRRRARAPPPDQGPAPADQPLVPPFHTLLPRARHRQPVRRAARHHQATRADQSRHRRRARALLAQPCRRAAGLPPQRGQDHAQDAGDHERRGGVARRRHDPRLRQRPGEPQPRTAGHRLPGACERLPGGLRRGVGLRRRPERGLPRRLQVHSVPGPQHLLPEETGTGDVSGEQPGRHHGVRLRRRPDLAPRAVHDRVLARDVAAGEDGWYILKGDLPVHWSPALFAAVLISEF